MLSRTYPQKGVSLIELLIGVSIMAILLAIGMPSFNSWIQNTRIRTATESIQNGLQLARAEAVRRNEQVNFILGTGSSWTVSTVAAPGTVIQSRSSNEGSTNVTVVATPAGATTATFNTLGRIANTAAAPTQIDVDMSTTILPASQSRELRVNITSGGQIRTCDPIITATDDPRKC